MAKVKRVPFADIPQEVKDQLSGVSPAFVEEAYQQHLEKNPPAEPSVGEPSNPVTTPTINTEPLIPVETAPDEPEEVLPLQAEPEEVIDGAIPAAPQTQHPKGSLDAALREEREENKRLKREREEREQKWQNDFSTLREQVAQLSKQNGLFGTIQVPQVAPPKAEPLPIPQPFTAVNPYQQPYQEPVQQPAAPMQNPTQQYVQEVIRQTMVDFKRATGREPREDQIDDPAGYNEDNRIWNALQTGVQLRVDKKILEQQEQQRREQEEQQSTIQTFGQWFNEERTQPDILEVDQYATAQLNSFPEWRKAIVRGSLQRLLKPDEYGKPSKADLVTAQYFWQLCRSQLGHQKILNAQQHQPEPETVQADVVSDVLPAVDTVAAVAATKKKLDAISGLPRTSLVAGGGSGSPGDLWTMDKLKKAAQTAAGYQTIPAQYREFLMSNGLRGKPPRS